MYYEVAGEDEAFVLLHGWFGGAHVWTGQVPTQAMRYRVNIPEQRGRGHSPDVEGPITCQGLADDAAGTIERVVGGPTNLDWASDGASHAVFMEQAELLNGLILDFLAANAPPQTMLPVRRARASGAS
jgi:pimeloyl-ACP methyl ester carboxylesterase